MSSYIQSFADFVQKKENDVNRVVPMLELEDEDDMPSPAEIPNPPKSSSNYRKRSSAHLYTGVDNAGSPNSNSGNKMEHSYTRDTTNSARTPAELTTGLPPARTILVRRPPQCPSCHAHPLEEHEQEDTNRVPVPGYNELAAKDAMSESTRLSKFEKNSNCDDGDWEARVNQLGWSNAQKTLFEKVVRILDDDQLGRLANAGRQHEAMQRRVIIDKSATSMRRAFTRVLWDIRLTQWLHATMMEVLPESYMPSYLDVMQTLNAKLPSLMDKILFARPLGVSKDLLAPIMKPPWEPMINATKSRKLTQNAVIVALPSAPTSGPVPNRLQQWYRQLATITQIVQVTLPMTSGHVMRQPLEQIAEQIVSLTRVKIQEIRAENAQRNIVLVGFNAGAALALQVALSETVSCIVCMGFAYHTFNGVRGMPDDRMLEIKSPILFVIGQNSARASTEELESLREKMVSETSLVVVGSADDNLRVPKSRRKIENVTQAMVDTMVVDEVYDFISKSLTNPPGPRIPTNYTGQIHSKHHNRASMGLVTPGDGKSTGTQQRKRKQDGSGALEAGEYTASKTRCTTVGRPRARPLPTGGTITKGASGFSNLSMQQQRTQLAPSSSPALSTASGSGALTNDDLNTAIQSILDDVTPDPQDSYGSTGVTISPKQVTNFELITSSKTSPNKLTLINSSLPMQQPHSRQSSVSPTVGTKIKMIPSNQFVQLKPPLQSQSKIYTIKKSAMLNQAQKTGGGSSGATNTANIATTASGTTPLANSGQQQIFTLKSPNGKTTQFVTAAPAAAKQKYTVMKNAAGGTTLQLTPKSAGGGIDFSNIIDMPIIFADNEGNLTDTVGGGDAAGVGRTKGVAIASQTTPKSTTSGVGQLIISQKIIKEANIVAGSAPAKVGTYAGTIQSQQPHLASTKLINSAAGGGAFVQSGNKPKQLVYINRNSMKPCPNIISRNALATQVPKFTKLVVQNSSSSSAGASTVSAVKHVNLQALRAPTIGGSGGLAIRPASTTITPASGILNVATKSLPQIQIIGSTAPAGSTTTAVTAGTPRNSGAQPIRNIVLKPGGLKHIPEHLKTQLFNRNLTVRKLVNIVPASKSAVNVISKTSSCSVVTPADTAAAHISISSSAIQTSPKIITLNPINPSAVAPPSLTTDT